MQHLAYTLQNALRHLEPFLSEFQQLKLAAQAETRLVVYLQRISS